MTQSLTDLVAEAVRAEMARRRVSQMRVGEILGISQPQVSKRLLGQIAFDTNELQRLADAWSIPVSSLTATGRAA